MLGRCCRTGALDGCFAVEVDCYFPRRISASYAAGSLLRRLYGSTTLLATTVLYSCIRLSWLGFRGGGPPRVFLAIHVCLWDFVGNPEITYESFVLYF